MKKICVGIGTIILVLSFNSSAFGQWGNKSGTSQKFGNTTIHNFSDGNTGTSQDFGGTTIHNFSDGNTGTSQEFGGTTIHNFP